MDTITYEQLVGDPQIQVGPMAHIVKDLIAGGLPRLRDESWLRERADAACLATHEYEALETLRIRIRDGGTSLLDAVAELRWN